MISLLLLVIPFVIPGLLIAAGAHYIVALSIGLFILICIGRGMASDT